MPRHTLQRLFLKSFTKLPAGLVSEPFELFLVTLALSDSLTLLFHYFLGSAQPSLPYYHGVVGLLLWSGLVAAASVIMIWALVKLDNHNLLEVRKLEITGLWLYAVVFGYYVYGNLSVGLSSSQPLVFTILPATVISMLVLACAVRAISLASPITALTVTRVNRVRLIQDQLKATLSEDSSKKLGE